ncbi:hypothetical protein C7S15_8179 [Burkholderia cepacia]|nr:hypothetical protein [Burkholderia cepacia]
MTSSGGQVGVTPRGIDVPRRAASRAACRMIAAPEQSF